MIDFILSEFLFILVLLSGSAIILFIFGINVICRFFSHKKVPTSPTIVKNATIHPDQNFQITSKDISAIAGEDPFNTQLDLARAYLETGRYKLANKILNYVVQHGSSDQQKEAGRLLNLFNV